MVCSIFGIKMNRKNWFLHIVFLLLLSACSSTKFVPEGKYLLNKQEVEIDNKKADDESYTSYLRQQPNKKFLGTMKLRLKIYSLSGKDTTKKFNKWLRKKGEAPIVHDPELIQTSMEQLQKVMHNKGYMDASVSVDSVIKKKKINLTYRIKTGEIYSIRDFSYQCKDSSLIRLFSTRGRKEYSLSGSPFNLGNLDEERDRVTKMARNRGRYYFSKDFVSYLADSSISNHQVDVIMRIEPPHAMEKGLRKKALDVSRIHNVYIHLMPPMRKEDTIKRERDTLFYKGVYIISQGDRWLLPETLIKTLSIHSRNLYSDRASDATYNSLSSFSIIKFISIDYNPLPLEDTSLLDCHIHISQSKPIAVGAEIMGTNTGGDIGAVVQADFQYKNLGQRGILFDTKVKGDFEKASIVSGDYSRNYIYEFGGDLSLTFPKLLLPFSIRNRLMGRKGTTSIFAGFTRQLRPEYNSDMLDFSWKYKFNTSTYTQHSIGIPFISYVKTTDISPSFINYIAENNINQYINILQPHLILGMNYQISYTNQRRNRVKPYEYHIKATVEAAGNLLYAISSLTNGEKDDNNRYDVLGIPYSQYVRVDFKFANAFRFNPSSSLHLCLVAGVAIPYGNSTDIPYEKKFYAGGANGVRGWSIKTLGPGNDKSFDGYFSLKMGDMNLFASIEHRLRLFWKLESALFFDAGNIWSISNDLGKFSLNSFYKEIALAYGIGVRLNFDFFVVRVDLGMKLYDPAGSGTWKKPLESGVSNLCFAIGYPF
ncbi:MAG TPA: hypothetical protein DDY68_01610 [Porphyromonadaceae bacterium]|nr:hypothetical protein [Porphyromonadaceae bacterium]